MCKVDKNLCVLSRVKKPGRPLAENESPAICAPKSFIEGTDCLVQGIEREYQELDTVWFMAGSLFKNYPYDIPTEAFPLALFKQAGHLLLVMLALFSHSTWLCAAQDSDEEERSKLTLLVGIFRTGLGLHVRLLTKTRESPELVSLQAFAAVQASVVHLQGVPLCKRFALVPLGPPCTSYSSTSKVKTSESGTHSRQFQSQSSFLH